ncbi:MAG: PLD nuclease N-terminal domain-containing protein [Pseudodesulfovibrio sp.]
MFPDFSAVTPVQWAIAAAALAVCFSFSAWTILDAWKRDFEMPSEKVGWMQLCIFIPIFGSLAYLFIGRKRGTKRG